MTRKKLFKRTRENAFLRQRRDEYRVMEAEQENEDLNDDDERVIFESAEMIAADRESETNIATAEDIKARIREQGFRYIELEKSGELTTEWRKYGMKHADEIQDLRQRSGKEK